MRFDPKIFYAAGVVVLTLFLTILLHHYVSITPFYSYVISINLAAFTAMGLDKMLARAETIRIPERILYLAALLGGTGGVLIGMRSFRHKTRKTSFNFWLIAIITTQLGIWWTVRSIFS